MYVNSGIPQFFFQYNELKSKKGLKDMLQLVMRFNPTDSLIAIHSEYENISKLGKI